VKAGIVLVPGEGSMTRINGKIAMALGWHAWDLHRVSCRRESPLSAHDIQQVRPE